MNSGRLSRAPGLLIMAMAMALAALASACGGSQRMMLEPQEREAREQEIASLLAEIESLDQEQRASYLDYQEDVCGDAPDGPDSVDDDGAEYYPAEAAPRVQAGADREVGMSTRRLVRIERENMCHLKDEEREPTCTDVCRLASSICDNAERICRIADELGGDEWADERCATAARTCAQADARCCGCG